MQYKYILPLILLLTLFTATAHAQQGIAVNATGNAPDSSAILDVQSTAKGMLVPRMSAVQRTGIATPANGLLVYDTDSTAFFFYTGAAWAKIATGNATGDNLGNHTATQNIKLNNNWLSNDGNNDGIRIDNNGLVSVNTATPVAQSKLTIAGSTSITGFDGNFGLGGNRALIDYSGGYMRLGTVNGGGAATNGIGFLANGAEKMRLLATGSLGVNNNNPGATLDVTGNASVGTGNTVTGSNSLAVGNSNTVTGSSSFAAGSSNAVSGNGSYAVGGNNVVTSINSMAIGLADTSAGYASFVANRENNASGNHAAAFGNHTQAPSYDEFAIGAYGTIYTPASATGFNPNDRLFNVGNGNTTTASDAFTILKNGNTGIGNSTPAEKLDVAGNIKSTDTVKTAKFRMTNGATNGYVLTGDANGNAKWTSPNSLGVTETDPQVSSSVTYKVPRWNGTTLVDGSMYDSSGRVGIGTTTPGATLDVAGNASIGGANLVAGPSFAAGYMDTATGYASFVANRGNNASGNHSAAFGNHNQALSYEEFVIGQYSTAYTPASTIGFNSADRLFNIGNGTGATATADAFTILKNGKVGIGRSIPAANLDVAGTFVSGTANTATGAQAAVIGGSTNMAAGTNAVAGGTLSYVSNSNSVAIGTNDTVTSQSAVALGNYNKVTGIMSVAMGSSNLAGGPQSFAVGNHNIAGGYGSTATGAYNTANGTGATAFGSSNGASGDYTFTAGRENQASGSYSVAIGRRASTNGKEGSFVLGDSSLSYTYSDTTNQMKMRFQGGYKLYADAAQSRGIQIVPATGVAKYFSNVASSYDAQSLVDKNYVDSNVSSRITGIVETDPQVSSTATNKVPKWNGTTLVDGQIYDDGTNIGIGTTTPNAPLHVLAAQGSAKIESTNDIATYLSLVTPYRKWMIGNDKPLDNTNLLDGFWIYDSTAQATRLYIDVNGNTGIGTTTPGAKLDVSGNINSSGQVKTNTLQMTNGANAGYVLTSDAAGNATWTLPAAAGTTHTLTASGTNVTSTVNGVAATLNIAPAVNAAETDPQVSSATTNKVPKWNGTTLVDGVMTDDGANIGIGTTTPGAKLDVAGIMRVTGATAANLELNSPTTPTIYPNGSLTPANQNMEVRSAGSGTLALNFSNAGSIQMAAGGGGVLIGTGATLAAKLDVNGTVKIGSTGTVLNSIVRAGIGLTGSTSAPAYSAFALSFTVNGATVTGTATASPTAPLSTGFVISSVYVSAANVVTVIIQNVTNTALVFNYPSFFVTVIN